MSKLTVDEDIEKESEKKRTVYDDIRDGINVEKYQIDYEKYNFNNNIKIEKEDEVEEQNINNKNRRPRIKPRTSSANTLQRVFTALFGMGSIGIIMVLFLLYGPYSGFREWLVTTAMTTMTHQYFATWFYDDDTIDYILDKNRVIEINETTNTNSITIGSIGKNGTKYENEYERQILERDSKNNDYKIIEIKGKKYDGYLVAVYDPSRVHTVCTKKLGTSGQYLTKMAEDNDALIAINGGGFDDPNFNSTGGSPVGITVSFGKYLTTKSYAGSGGIIGFTDEDKFVLGKITTKEAKSMGIRDAVTFGPYLIVNGKASSVLGNGGWGQAPRTAIAQRKDGIVLFLVLDGRTASKPGADMNDLIEILQNYGAINAANLDGGTSSVLVVNNVIVNDPIDSSGAHKTRPIATGFILSKDDSDDSDHTVVQDVLDK